MLTLVFPLEFVSELCYKSVVVNTKHLIFQGLTFHHYVARSSGGFWLDGGPTTQSPPYLSETLAGMAATDVRSVGTEKGVTIVRGENPYRRLNLQNLDHERYGFVCQYVGKSKNLEVRC